MSKTPSTMRTHKDCLYVRKPGDKWRPIVNYHRPTLQQVGARLRVIKRRIAELNAVQKPGAPESPLIPKLVQARQSLLGYLESLSGKQAKKPTFTEKLKRFFRVGRQAATA